MGTNLQIPNQTPSSRDQSPEHNHFEPGENVENDEDNFEDDECSDESDSSSETQDISDAVREDMIKLEEIFEENGMNFRLINRIGEGTFSTVYKAEDLDYHEYLNDWDADNPEYDNWPAPSEDRHKEHDRRADAMDTASPPGNVEKSRFVAIKKIYVTSSPLRIQNELELLHILRGSSSICPLITAFRHQDQVVAVLPHFRHQDFRTYYRNMTVRDIKIYFKSLFVALAAVHKQGIIHRDIKPTNFLYDAYREQGVLVDFGLAEREGTDCSHCLCQEHPTNRKSRIQNSTALNQKTPTGYPKDDNRPPRRANRAGTRGFRAPEVLLKCTAQTTKIDIWSAGVILLTILAQRFPFFHSADDVDAMVEIASIFGKSRMRTCAILHGALFECTLNTIGEKGFPLSHIVQWSTSNTRPEEKVTLPSDVIDAVKFLEQLLELDPRKRISARAALASEFLTTDVDTEEEGTEEMEVL